MIKVQQYLISILIALIFAINPVFAADKRAQAQQKVYVFHTALQSPIKEILDTRISEAFRRLGLKAEVRINPSSQRALMLANEEGDGDAGRVPQIKTIAPDNTANLIQVQEPIVTLTLNVYTKDLTFPVEGWDSLQNYHNGARIGAKILEKNIPGQRTFLPTTVQLVQMVDSGRIDTMVEWDLIADYAIKNLGMTLKKLSPPIIAQPFHIYLHKNHPALVPKLNKVLQQMKEDGSFSNHTTDFTFYTGIGSPVKEILEKRLQEAFKRAGGYTFKLLYPGSSQRSLVLANEDGDGDAARILELKQVAPTVSHNLIRISESITMLQFQVYSNGAITKVEGYESLAHLRNGFRVGIKILEKNMPGEPVTLPDTSRLLQMLNDGRLDTVVEWTLIADTFLAKNQYPNIMKLPTPLVTKPIYPYIHQKHHALVAKLTQALQEMKKDGTFSQIEEDVLKQIKP